MIVLSPSSPKRNHDLAVFLNNRMLIWSSIYRLVTKLGLFRFLALMLLCTFLGHRSVSRYMSHRPWMLAPIAHVERTCTAPSYQTLSEQEQQESVRNNNNNHKICLTTLTDEKQKSRATKLLGWRNFDGLLELTWKNKQDYADKHGYHLYNESDMLDKSRPPSWSKIVAVERLLREENCTWVFWLDADTVIMNSDIRIQDFLPAYDDDDSIPSTTTKDLLMSVDTGGGYNAGVWLVRNTIWGRGFLDTWWNMKAFVKPVGLSHSGDNDALKALLHSMPAETLQEHVLAPARCTFNSFIKVVAPKLYDQVEDSLKEQDFYLSEAYYHKGDFIAHVAGVDNKVDTMKMLLEAAQ